MRKRILMMGLLMLALAGGVVMPRMVQSSIPTAYYVMPDRQVYKNVVQCSGTIQSQQVCQVVVQAPVVPGEVLVSVGDVVEAGQTLAVIDQVQTEQLLKPLSLLQELSDGLGSTAVSAEDWAALASSYGLDTGVSGDAMMESVQSVEELLGADSVQAASEVFSIGSASSEITAPIDGVVTSVELQSGIATTAGKAVIIVADNSAYKAVVSVPEADIELVQIGDQAEVRGSGFSGTVYTGTVTRIYPTAQKILNGTTMETVVTAEVTLDRADAKLKPGLTAEIEIQGEENKTLLTVPYEAIRQDEQNNEYVYLYEDGKIKKQIVVTGRELTEEVEVTSGIQPDSIVIYQAGDASLEGGMVQLKGRLNDH